MFVFSPISCVGVLIFYLCYLYLFPYTACQTWSSFQSDDVMSFNLTRRVLLVEQERPIVSHHTARVFKDWCCWIFCFLCILCRSLIVIFAFWHLNCLSFYLRFVIPIYWPWVTEWLKSLTTKPKYLTYNTTDISSPPDIYLPHIKVLSEFGCVFPYQVY